MTNRYSPPNRSLIDQEKVIPWVNVSGEEIPAFGVIQLRQNFDETSKADKPDGTSGLFFVNGPVLVRSEADTAGESYLWDKPRRVLLAADATVGDEVGPSEGSWEMSSSGSGWRVLRQAISGVGVVVQTGGGGGDTRWGIVISADGCGMYTVELGTLNEDPAASGSGSGSGSCDPCVGVTGAGTSACGLELDYPASRVTGSGVYVTAYDPQSTLIPLRAGTDCVVSKGSIASTPASGSGSGSGSGVSGSTWAVFRGFQEHIVEYRERYQCCDDGTVKLVAKTPVVFVGKVCEEILCEECPASGSG